MTTNRPTSPLSSSDGPVNLVNVTPHAVRLVSGDGSVLAELPPTGPPARRTELTVAQPPLAFGEVTVPVLRLFYGPVENLPAPAPGTAYVVSRPVADACPDRDDLLVPAQLVRDADGVTTGCHALARGAATR